MPPEKLTKKLTAIVEPLLLDNPEDPRIIELEGVRYVVKFYREIKIRRWKEWVSALAALVLFGVRVTPKKLRTLDIYGEVERLKSLKAAGVKVPAVPLQGAQFFVMEYVGESLNDYLKKCRKTESPAQFEGYYQAVIDSLIDLHQRGQWHGGAQLRNLTIKGNELFRIDFEENTGNAMPLALAQAFDVIQSFISLASHTTDQQMGTALLLRYLEATQDAEVLRALRKTNRYLRWANRLVTPLLSKKMRQASDVRAILFLVAILDAAMEKTE